MKQYSVKYIDKDGDHTSCWVHASNPKEAEANAREEHWDIDEVQVIREIK